MTSWKQFWDEALQKGEKVKEDLMVELVHSKLFSELVKNDKFIQAITTAVRTKDEISGLIHKQVKHLLQFMDIPSRKDIEAMNAKVGNLSHQLDRIGQRVRLKAGKAALAGSAKAAAKRKAGGRTKTRKSAGASKTA